MRVAVTGGSGKLGRHALAALEAAGHRAVNLDIAPPRAGSTPFIRVDVTDFGEVMGALSGIDPFGRKPDAVLHLAGIPAPGLSTDEAAFRVNTLAAYNVFSAAARLGIDRVVWASSETILGLPFDVPPDYAPIDEAHPLRPRWSYALAKRVGETLADTMVAWRPSLSIASLRFSNVLDDADYDLKTWSEHPRRRRWNLWSHVHGEDAGLACRLALEANFAGHAPMIIAGPDTVMPQPSAALMAESFPGVEVRGPATGRYALLSSAKAERLIGYRPQRRAIAGD